VSEVPRNPLFELSPGYTITFRAKVIETNMKSRTDHDAFFGESMCNAMIA